MFEAKSLTLGFHQELLLENITFSLAAGNLLTIRGPNGVGKSSLLQVLSGIKKPLKGSVTLNGRLLDEYLHKGKILFLGHDLGLIPELTLEEHLKRLMAIYPIQQVDLERFELKGLEELPVSHLSAGQKRRFWLSILNEFKGQLLLLDEPFLALDKEARVLLEQVLANYLAAKQGVVVIATHLAEKVKFCSHEIELAEHLPQTFS